MDPRQSIIEAAFEDRANINPSNASTEIKATVASLIADLKALAPKVRPLYEAAKAGK